MVVPRVAPGRKWSGNFKMIIVALLSYLMGRLHTNIAFNCAHNCNECNDISKATKPLEQIHDETLMPALARSSQIVEYLPNRKTDAYNYFHRYISLFSNEGPEPPKDFNELPLLHIWPTYFETYHNHWQRYRGKEVVFLEIGIQSGGKIPMLRKYFGPGLTYIGIDVNENCRRFDNVDWVHIEIGDSSDRAFLDYIKKKYPKIDLILDDGGHVMNQQRTAIMELLPHLDSKGVYMCEDLSTSWSNEYGYGGIPFQDSRNSSFLLTTMYGFVHRTIDWLNSGYIPGKVMSESIEEIGNFFGRDESWWKTVHDTVKSIHVYNQVVVYEKGYVNEPFATMTIGEATPFDYVKELKKTDWNSVMSKLEKYNLSHW